MRKTRLTRKSSHRAPPLGRKGRKPSETTRIYGPKPFRDWLHQQPCVITGLRSHIEQVHVIGGGVGRKAGWRFTVPMTDELHRELHQHGVQTFEAQWRVNLVCLAGMIQDRWRAYEATAVLHTTEPLCVTCEASFQEVGNQCASCAYQPPRDAA